VGTSKRQPPGTGQLYIRAFPNDLKHRLNVLAAEAETSVATLATELLERAVEQAEARREQAILEKAKAKQSFKLEPKPPKG